MLNAATGSLDPSTLSMPSTKLPRTVSTLFAAQQETDRTESGFCEVCRIVLTDEEKAVVATRNFSVHEYKTDKGRQTLVALAAHMFETLGFLDKYNVDRGVMLRFITRISLRYRDVPYHNFFHAFDVTQTLFYLLKLLPDTFSDLEKFVLLICGLCHDVDHMGVNNSFHYKAETPLGILSNTIGSSSPLEVHHCNVTFEILQHPGCNVFDGMKNKGEQTFCFKTIIRLKTALCFALGVRQAAIPKHCDYVRQQ